MSVVNVLYSLILNYNENDTLFILFLWYLFQTWLSKIIFSKVNKNIQEHKMLVSFQTLEKRLPFSVLD